MACGRTAAPATAATDGGGFGSGGGGEYSSGGGGLLRATPASVNWGQPEAVPVAPRRGYDDAGRPTWSDAVVVPGGGSGTLASPPHSAKPPLSARSGSSVETGGRVPTATLYSPVRFDTDAAPVF
jgi:hypothetical protein